MRNILILIICVVLSLSIFSLIHKIRKSNSGGITQIRFSTKLIDVGNKKMNDSVFAIYTVHNIGSNDLFIESVEPDCHCTASSYAKNPIKPNDSSNIILKYDSSIPGIFQSTALVTMNTKTSPILLVFRGEIIQN